MKEDCVAQIGIGEISAISPEHQCAVQPPSTAIEVLVSILQLSHEVPRRLVEDQEIHFEELRTAVSDGDRPRMPATPANLGSPAACEGADRQLRRHSVEVC